jgi:CheY-like chemotaxis protein
VHNDSAFAAGILVLPRRPGQDLRLPGVSGTKILKRIRADERLADTSVLVVTAHWEDAEETVEGADLVLLKPIEFLQLRDLALRFRPKASQDRSADK